MDPNVKTPTIDPSFLEMPFDCGGCLRLRLQDVRAQTERVQGLRAQGCRA